MSKTATPPFSEKKIQISHFNYVKVILINLGIVFTAVTLIVLGLYLINETRNLALQLALVTCLIITFTCFLALVPINNKLRELRSHNSYRAKHYLIQN
jgi:flagellar motor component MotA